MAAAFMLFLLLTAFTAATAQQKNSNISLGSSITPTANPAWFSPSGIFAFGFYQLQLDGYAVSIFFANFSERTVVWTANRDNPIVPNNVNLLLTNDGRLILQKSGSQDQYPQIVNHSEPIRWASMLDNGNFVLYSSDGRVIWQSFDHPTDSLLPGQRLAPAATLFSNTSETDFAIGKFMLAMQTDGNLVQYPVGFRDTPRDAYYATDTSGAGGNVLLNLENDGRLYLLNGSSILLNLTRGGYPVAGTIYLMRIDVDGIFRLYNRSLDRDGHWTSIWSSTEDKCAPKGLCGPNSFCTYQNQIVDCECLPGTDFVRSGDRSAGCNRNFSLDGCINKDESIKYEIRRIPNVTSEDTSYIVLNKVTEEQCGRDCLDDCSCEVAFFQDGQCRKQKLPLRYGKKTPRDPYTALVRVTTPASGAQDNSGKKIERAAIRHPNY